jgi:hypothetical protein
MAKFTQPTAAAVLRWPTSKVDFEADGSLRDIYVLDTTLDDWSKVLAFVAAKPFDASLTCEGHQVELPWEPRRLFPTIERALRHLLSLRVGDVELCCHFFIEEEIEFDFWPNGMTEDKLGALLSFMCDLGALTGKTVILTPENYQARPIFRYDPGLGIVEFVSA